MQPSTKLNNEVSNFLKELQHPLIKEITVLRQLILNAEKDLAENIKWNGPNYHINGADRITMRIQPPKHLQLIFHRGAKVQQQPKEKLIKDGGLLTWKENDRAIVAFKNAAEIESKKEALVKVIKDWVKASF